MSPYADFFYFGILLYLALPTLLIRRWFGFSRAWVLLATAAMLIVQYATIVHLVPVAAVEGLHVTGGSSISGGLAEVRDIWVVVAFGLFQWSLAQTFLWLRTRTTWYWPFPAALALALLPLIGARVVPMTVPGAQLGFLGISYVTFRTLDVVFGIRDRLIVSLPAGQYFAFLFFFPTISSGPIDRYRRFNQDWNRPRRASEFWSDLDRAVHRIFTGFLYKFILAASIKSCWIDYLPQGGFLNTLSYMYGYSLYLYFDFAGYSAFAVGVSHVLGTHTPENFNRPFFATNIKEFWNRWHISLSTWLRDHVYMRFMLAAAKGRWFAGKYTASYLGFFLTFGLMGLWHGIEPYYLLYGLYHGLLVVGHDLFTRWNKPRQVWGKGPIWRATGALITFHLVCLGFLLFSGRIGPTWKPVAPVAPVAREAASPFAAVPRSLDVKALQTWAGPAEPFSRSWWSDGPRPVRLTAGRATALSMEWEPTIVEGFVR
jgi:membrane protein involved in D-alanine export